MSEQPFFIVGHPRSGTTLLRMILCAHSRLYIPEETGFLPFLKTPHDRHLSRREIRSLLERIGSLNAYWRDMVPSEEIEAFFPLNPTLAEAINILYQLKCIPHEAVRWGDKTPLYVRYIPEIIQIFPQAQFIHLIRDGRDAAISARKKWGRSSPYMDIYYLLKNWNRNVRTGRSQGVRLGHERYMEIFYEKLVTSPGEVVRQVCSFLGEDFEQAMLDHTVTARKIGPGHGQHNMALEPIFTKSVGRWKSEMTSFEQKMAERISGECLAEFGYQRSGTEPLSARERLTFTGYAIKFAMFDSLRTLLYRAGWLTLNRTMRSPKVQAGSPPQ